MRNIFVVLVLYFLLISQHSAIGEDILDSIQVDMSDLSPVLFYSYYELPKIVKTCKILKTLHAKSKGVTNEIGINLRKRKDHFGFEFTGFINIEKSGEYEFFLTSDDGSALFLNNKKVIDNDGFHGPVTKQVKLFLKKGLHPITVLYFQGASGATLDLQYSGPGISKCKLPASVLFNNRKYITAFLVDSFTSPYIVVTAFLNYKYKGEKAFLFDGDSEVDEAPLAEQEGKLYAKLTVPNQITAPQSRLKVKVGNMPPVPIETSCLFLNKKQNLQTENQGPPEKFKVISIASFDNLSDRHSTGMITLATRDQLAAEMVSKYSCYVTCRSNGYNLALEDQISAIKSIDSAKLKPSGIPAVDYAVTGYFKRSSLNNSLECVVQILDPSVEDGVTHFIVPIPSIYDAPGIIAKALSDKLNLKERSFPLLKPGDTSKATWAVLPFARLDVAKPFASSREDKLSLIAELTLQNQPTIKNIVDRRAIDAVLDELKVFTMEASTERMAGNLAKIIGADRILMGTVSPYKNGLSRLDLVLVDGISGFILSTRSAICKQEYIEYAVRELTADLAKYSYRVPEVKIATREERQREGELYFDAAQSSKDWRARRLYFVMNKAMLLESAYYLMQQDPKKTFDIVSQIGNIHWAPKEMLEHFRRLAFQMLQPITETNELQQPLILKGWYCSEPKQGIEFVKEHIRKYPDITPDYAYRTLVLLYMQIKQYRKAADLLTHLKSGFIKLNAIVNIYKHIDNDKEEFEHLKTIKVYYSHYYNHPYLHRIIELSRKIDGPEKTLTLLNHISGRSFIRPDIRYEYAYCLALSGKRDLAARIFTSLLKTDNRVLMAGGSKYFIIDKTPQKFKKRIRNTMKKLNLKEIDEKWDYAYNFNKIPDECKIYLVPIGTVSDAWIEKVKKAFKTVVGVNIQLAKSGIPLSALSEKCYSRKTRMIDVDRLASLLMNNVQLPSDALYVVFITGEPATAEVSCYDNLGWEIFSYYRKSSELKLIIHSFLDLFLNGEYADNSSVCHIFPCAACEYSWGQASDKLCESCQNKYETVDFKAKMNMFVEQRKQQLKNAKFIIK